MQTGSARRFAADALVALVEPFLRRVLPPVTSAVAAPADRHSRHPYDEHQESLGDHAGA